MNLEHREDDTVMFNNFATDIGELKFEEFEVMIDEVKGFNENDLDLSVFENIPNSEGIFDIKTTATNNSTSRPKRKNRLKRNEYNTDGPSPAKIKRKSALSEILDEPMIFPAPCSFGKEIICRKIIDFEESDDGGVQFLFEVQKNPSHHKKHLKGLSKNLWMPDLPHHKTRCIKTLRSQQKATLAKSFRSQRKQLASAKSKFEEAKIVNMELSNCTIDSTKPQIFQDDKESEECGEDCQSEKLTNISDGLDSNLMLKGPREREHDVDETGTPNANKDNLLKQHNLSTFIPSEKQDFEVRCEPNSTWNEDNSYHCIHHRASWMHKEFLPTQHEIGFDVSSNQDKEYREKDEGADDVEVDDHEDPDMNLKVNAEPLNEINTFSQTSVFDQSSGMLEGARNASSSSVKEISDDNSKYSLEISQGLELSHDLVIGNYYSSSPNDESLMISPEPTSTYRMQAATIPADRSPSTESNKHTNQDVDKKSKFTLASDFSDQFQFEAATCPQAKSILVSVDRKLYHVEVSVALSPEKRGNNDASDNFINQQPQYLNSREAISSELPSDGGYITVPSSRVNNAHCIAVDRQNLRFPFSLDSSNHPFLGDNSFPNHEIIGMPCNYRPAILPHPAQQHVQLGHQNFAAVQFVPPNGATMTGYIPVHSNPSEPLRNHHAHPHMSSAVSPGFIGFPYALSGGSLSHVPISSSAPRVLQCHETESTLAQFHPMQTTQPQNRTAAPNYRLSSSSKSTPNILKSAPGTIPKN